MQYINVALKNGCAECGKVLESVRGKCQYFFTINKLSLCDLWESHSPLLYKYLYTIEWMRQSNWIGVGRSLGVIFTYFFLCGRWPSTFWIPCGMRPADMFLWRSSYQNRTAKKKKRRMLRVSVSCSLFRTYRIIDGQCMPPVAFPPNIKIVHATCHSKHCYIWQRHRIIVFRSYIETILFIILKGTVT